MVSCSIASMRALTLSFALQRLTLGFPQPRSWPPMLSSVVPGSQAIQARVSPRFNLLILALHSLPSCVRILLPLLALRLLGFMMLFVWMINGGHFVVWGMLAGYGILDPSLSPCSGGFCCCTWVQCCHGFFYGWVLCGYGWASLVDEGCFLCTSPLRGHHASTSVCCSGFGTSDSNVSWKVMRRFSISEALLASAVPLAGLCDSRVPLCLVGSSLGSLMWALTEFGPASFWIRI